MKKLKKARGFWAFVARQGWIAVWTTTPLALAFAIVLAPAKSVARVFDFKNESLATYFKGTYGPSAVGDNAFGDAAAEGTVSYDKKVQTNYGGEIGVLFATQSVNFRAGLEYLLPRRISDAKGTGVADDSEYFELDTKTTALIPKAGIDIVIRHTATSKVLLDISFGMGYGKIENIYKLTAAGTAATGAGDFVEKSSAQASYFQTSLGYEALLTDHTTLVFDAGYRMLRLDGFEHETAARTFSGEVAKGDPMLNADGSGRKIDMSGAFVGLAFRFYIGL